MNVNSAYAIIIPTYNHEKHLRRVIESTLQLGLPVFVIDDGSTDSTAKILASVPGITVLHHEKNLGKGAALLTGFNSAAPKADWAITIDADGQHNPGEIPSLIGAIPEGKRSLIIGKREGMEEQNVPWTSRWGRRFSNFWIWAACGRWFSDSQSGFRIYPLPEIIRLGTRARRFQFEVEILILAVWHGIPIVEVPVHASYGSNKERVSHFRPCLDFWRNTRTFARLVVTRLCIPARLRK